VNVWVEALVAVLLLASGALSLIGAVGMLRMKTFFQRMHPPALATTLGSWCVTLGCVLYFSALESRLGLHNWLIIILLAITAPVSTTLLARAALFRRREVEMQARLARSRNGDDAEKGNVMPASVRPPGNDEVMRPPR
jgi:multicomponent K+:H+ antiporter subunit G